MTYLALLEQDGPTWGGLIPELNVSVADPSRERLLILLAEGLALAIHTRQTLGLAVPTPALRAAADLPAELRADFPNGEVVLIGPAPMNPVSLAVQATLTTSGLSDREVARRMNTGHASLARLKDPFYWGQSVSSLRALAEALGVQLSVTFQQAS